MAHLQCQGYKPDAPTEASHGRGSGRGGPGGHALPSPQAPPPADLHQTLAFLGQLAAGALPGMARTAQQQQPRHLRWGDGGSAEADDEAHGLPADLGVLLWGFFDRFGGCRAAQGRARRGIGCCPALRTGARRF